VNIPYQNMEIELIYTQLLSNPHTSIAICAAQEGEGVTSLAFALAQRNLLAGHSTLLVDLNLYHPAIQNLLNINNNQLVTTKSTHTNTALATQHQQHNDLFVAPQLVCNRDQSIVLTGITAPKQRDHIMKIRQPGALEECIEEWLTQYDTVIIDTSPLNRINAQNIPPERVAAACDGALLIVLAGQTSEAAINNAVTKLTNANAQLLGSVLNDRDNPTLREELIREVQRLEPRLSWLSRSLKRVINKSRLLALEV